MSGGVAVVPDGGQSKKSNAFEAGEVFSWPSDRKSAPIAVLGQQSHSTNPATSAAAAGQRLINKSVNGHRLRLFPELRRRAVLAGPQLSTPD